MNIDEQFDRIFKQPAPAEDDAGENNQDSEVPS
ncbi:hypothetical protein [Synechococcus phage Yong-L1-251]|nr:hypothetical protein [Synechococcus phage Yong-L1-251]